ncbi:hypothetical protein B0T20DRAFT_476907 [Sordaria brevicollis]|uniref:Uncharacterized protein n=1 Tax=Sordaria brevicollis TaxID=83679 RepID=A0AAE0PJ59_SORBR|nr:hypothetical protein B0T20DRAFT_476907 [Sordaria brevicollis]
MPKPTKPTSQGVRPPHVSTPKNKQIADTTTATAPKVSLNRPNESRKRSADPKNESKPNMPIGHRATLPATASQATNQPANMGKRKRDETPDNDHKKLKTSEENHEPVANEDLNSLIEDRASDFTIIENLQAQHNLHPAVTTRDSTSRAKGSGDNPLKSKASEGVQEKPQKKWKLCIHCGEEFDPDAEDDDRYSDYSPCEEWHLGDMEFNRLSRAWREDACIDPWESGSGSEYDLDTEDWRIDCPGGFTWDCCGESGDSRGCEQREWHEAEESDEDDE